MDMSRVNNIVRIPASLKDKFFIYWLNFLAPFHGLTATETNVAAAFLKQRFELSKGITDQDLLDKILMSKETKQKIRKECNVSAQYFMLILGKLKKAKVIVDNKINPKFIPKNLQETDKAFQLLFYFDLDAGNNK